MISTRKYRTKNYKDMVTLYYDVITEPFRKIWGDFFHEAFFDNPKEDVKTAMSKTNKLFLNDAKIKTGNKVIDLGCGIGSFSCYIAQRINCEVVGVNISTFQLKKAKKMAKKKKINNVSFKKFDLMNINQIKDKFDAAFSIAVNCHLPNKGKVIKNIYSILKPGGRLIISDYLQKRKLNLFEKELLIEPFNHYWNYPYMESVEGCKKLLKQAGFKIITARDVSKEVKKNFDMYYDLALKKVQTMDFKTMASIVGNPAILKQGKKYIQIAKNQFYANIYGKVCAEAGVFKYGYFVAEK